MRTPQVRRRAEGSGRWILGGVLVATVILPLGLQGAPGTAVPALPRAGMELAAERRARAVDSISAVVGRRIDAPVVQKPLQGGSRSLNELGRTVCRLLHHNATDSLYRLCISEEELRDILWPEMLQSQGTGLTADDAWEFVSMRLRSGTTDAIGEFGGRYYEFLRWERYGAIKPYKNFKLHNGMVLVARRDDGDTLKMYWLRAVAERKGRFKIQSVRD